MQWSTLWGDVAANFPTANEARVRLACQGAYHEFMSFRQWSFREVTTASVALVAGTNKYTLLGPSAAVTDFDGMISVGLEMATGGEVRPLVEMQQSDFDRVFGHVRGNSQPAVFCVRGGAAQTPVGSITQGGFQQVQISPPPLATANNGVGLVFSYFRSVATMEATATTDIPLIPAQFHYALISGGNAYMAEAIGNLQRYQSYRQTFKERLAEAATSDSGMRLRDHQLLVFQSGASVYPITGQNEQTFDLGSRPYDMRGS